MQLEVKDVKKVAELARLEFTEAETEHFTDQLAKIVNFVEHLNEVDTAGVEEMAHPLDVHSVLRVDEQREGLSREQALVNSPSHDDGFFLVPPVMARKT